MLHGIATSLRILRPDWFPGGSRYGLFRRGPTLRVATTSSAHDSGILDALLQEFARASGCRPVVLTVGSGKALELVERRLAHVAITHAPRREQAARARKAVARPIPLMSNRYVLAGPVEAVAVLSAADGAADAMRRIAASGRAFVSRADGSGTHERERELWVRAGLPPEGGDFVRRAHAGMADALRTASAIGAFTLCDRSTFLKTCGGLRLAIAYEGNGELVNAYSVVLPATHASEHALRFADYLCSAAGRALIQGYRSDPFAEPLFAPAPSA